MAKVKRLKWSDFSVIVGRKIDPFGIIRIRLPSTLGLEESPTYIFVHENIFHIWKYFNSICEMKILLAKLVSICESSILYVKYMFGIPTFHMWNLEPGHFICEMFRLYMWNENFIYENVPIPYVFQMWNYMSSLSQEPHLMETKHKQILYYCPILNDEVKEVHRISAQP